MIINGFGGGGFTSKAAVNNGNLVRNGDGTVIITYSGTTAAATTNVSSGDTNRNAASPRAITIASYTLPANTNVTCERLTTYKESSSSSASTRYFRWHIFPLTITFPSDLYNVPGILCSRALTASGSQPTWTKSNNNWYGPTIMYTFTTLYQYPLSNELTSPYFPNPGVGYWDTYGKNSVPNGAEATNYYSHYQNWGSYTAANASIVYMFRKASDLNNLYCYIMTQNTYTDYGTINYSANTQITLEWRFLPATTWGELEY